VHLLINGEALRLPLKDNSVHCVVCSPPYWGLRSYGTPPRVWGGAPDCEHEWAEELPGDASRRTHVGNTLASYARFEEEERNSGTTRGAFCRLCRAWRGELGLEPDPDLFIEHLVEVFREVRRVLRPDGSAWVNMGDTFATARNGRSAKASKEAGTDDRTFRDKPFSSVVGGLKEKDLCGMPWRLALALQRDGWYLRGDIIWAKKNAMPCSVKDRPAPSHEYLFLLTKRKTYYYDAEAVKEKTGREASRSEYAAALGTNNGADSNRYGAGYRKKSRAVTHPSGRNLRSVWSLATEPLSAKRFGAEVEHYAAYPQKLVEPCIKAGTSEKGVCAKCGAPWERIVAPTEIPESGDYEGKDRSADPQFSPTCTCHGTFRVERREEVLASGKTRWRNHRVYEPAIPLDEHPVAPAIVLDPFVGSATTVIVAEALGRCGVGVDMSFDYLSGLAAKRIAYARANPTKAKKPRKPKQEVKEQLELKGLT
jgi:DNA modification methylase